MGLSGARSPEPISIMEPALRNGRHSSAVNSTSDAAPSPSWVARRRFRRRVEASPARPARRLAEIPSGGPT